MLASRLVACGIGKQWLKPHVRDVVVVVYLDTVLEAVKLEMRENVSSHAWKTARKTKASRNGRYRLTSQQELAIWQPAWPTILQKLASSTRRLGRP